MQSVCIYASDLAVLIRVNKYQKLSDLILKLWQKSYPNDYASSIKTFEQKHQLTFVPKETEMECVQRVCKENNIKFDDIKACLETEDTGELMRKRQKVEKQLQEKGVDKKVQEEFKKSLQSTTNKNFGTVQESSAVQLYAERHNKTVLTPPQFVKRKLVTYENTVWYIGGKIDGITEDNILIEVKNRIYRLFKTMRDYEKPQVQAYLNILQLKDAHLVESLKSKKTHYINVIEETYDEDYWDSFVLPRILQFIQLFTYFLTDTNLKAVMLLGTDEQKDMIINSFYDNIENP